MMLCDPWKVNLVTQMCLMRNILKTAGDAIEQQLLINR